MKTAKRNTIRFAILGLCLLTVLIYSSCSKDKTPQITVVQPPPPVFVDTISFSGEVHPIIQQNCAVSGCHNSAGSGGYVLLNYTQISTNSTIILKAIKHEPGVIQMPQFSPKLADTTIAKVEQWIIQGKLDN